MHMISIRSNLQKLDLVALLNLKARLTQNRVNLSIKHYSAVLRRKHQVIHQHRYIVALVDVLTHPQSLRRKRRRIYPKRLIIRYLLGFRGDSLTGGSVGANASRTNREIDTYLGTLLQNGSLDADGDGQALAMTDGLLMLRAMLGHTGTALTQGATNAAHPNVRNAKQILTWIEETHGVACLP